MSRIVLNESHAIELLTHGNKLADVIGNVINTLDA